MAAKNSGRAQAPAGTSRRVATALGAVLLAAGLAACGDPGGGGGGGYVTQRETTVPVSPASP